MANDKIPPYRKRQLKVYERFLNSPSYRALSKNMKIIDRAFPTGYLNQLASASAITAYQPLFSESFYKAMEDFARLPTFDFRMDTEVASKALAIQKKYERFATGTAEMIVSGLTPMLNSYSKNFSEISNAVHISIGNIKSILNETTLVSIYKAIENETININRLSGDLLESFDIGARYLSDDVLENKEFVETKDTLENMKSDKSWWSKLSSKEKFEMIISVITLLLTLKKSFPQKPKENIIIENITNNIYITEGSSYYLVPEAVSELDPPKE